MTIHHSVDTNLVAHDFLVATYGKLEQDKIDAAIEALKSATAVYPATITFAHMVFYTIVEVTVTGGKTFRGLMGGLTIPGGSLGPAYVSTDDLDALYARTVSFQFNATPVYFSILFFDEQNNLLGACQAAGISTTIGSGGGKGEWS